MAKYTVEQIKQFSPDVFQALLRRARNYLKTDPIMLGIFDHYGLDSSELDLIPIRFADLDVSAKTDHGIILLNYKMLCDGDFFKDYSYLIHEISHYCQQTTGTEPTKGAEDGEYLENPYEIEGFQNQIHWLADNFGDQEAERYTEQVVKHHDFKGKERKEKEDELMSKIE